MHFDGSPSRQINKEQNASLGEFKLVAELRQKDILLLELKNLLNAGKISHRIAALRIAYFVHGKEWRRSGENYFFGHVLRVAHHHKHYPEFGIPNSDRSIIAGLLHDVFEKKYPDARDQWNFSDLTFLQFSEENISDIKFLTKMPGELYLNYSMRAARDHVPTVKKLIDTIENHSDDPKPDREKLYSITIPYYAARLKDVIPYGHNIQDFARSNETYDADIFDHFYQDEGVLNKPYDSIGVSPS